MMEDNVLVSTAVAELKPSSFQSPKQTGGIEHHRVDGKPPLVFWWSFGRAKLLLHLTAHQPCDKSSNVVHLLDDLESEHEAVGPEEAPPQKSLVTAIGRPPGPAQTQSPVLQVESCTTGWLVETKVESLINMTQVRHSVAPAYPLHTTTWKLPVDHNDTGRSRGTGPELPGWSPGSPTPQPR